MLPTSLASTTVSSVNSSTNADKVWLSTWPSWPKPWPSTWAIDSYCAFVGKPTNSLCSLDTRPFNVSNTACQSGAGGNCFFWASLVLRMAVFNKVSSSSIISTGLESWALTLTLALSSISGDACSKTLAPSISVSNRLSWKGSAGCSVTNHCLINLGK